MGRRAVPVAAVVFVALAAAAPADDAYRDQIR